jgi:hypothetical protein
MGLWHILFFEDFPFVVVSFVAVSAHLSPAILLEMCVISVI